MRQYKLIAFTFCFLFSAHVSAATKLFLHDAYSRLGTVATGGVGIGCANGANDWIYRTATITQGTAGAAASYTFQPTSTVPPCVAQTQNSGEYLIFASPPISSVVTISGNINYSVGCTESTNGANMAAGFTVYRWTLWGGLVSVLHTSGNTTECKNGSYQLRTIAAAAPTSTTFQVGDRIVIRLESRASAAWGGNSSRTFGVAFGDASGSDGDTWVNFVDNITFSADTSARAPSVR